MNEQVETLISNFRSRYLHDPELTGCEIMHARGYHVVFLTDEIANEFARMKSKLFKSRNISSIVCGICYREFIIDDNICMCIGHEDCKNSRMVIIPHALCINVYEVFDKICKSLRLKRKSKRRKEREASADGYYTKEDIILLYNIQNHLCYYCMDAISDRSPGKYAIDHILPLVYGGSNWPTNLALACMRCNTTKGCSDGESFIQKIRKGMTAEWCSRHELFISEIDKKVSELFEEI